MSQLQKVVGDWSAYDMFYLTTTGVLKKELEKSRPVYVVGECNRQQPIRTLKVWMKCGKIIYRERPDVVISTGAAAGCMACFWGKLLGAKVIWIDSITNVERLSLSGRMVRWIADLFLVQWPKLASRYNNVEYAGTII